MADYCLFTIELVKARRIYVRGIADITEPIDEYDKTIKFYHGSELKSELPPNPYNKNEKDFELYEELLNTIKTDFEEIGDELVFAGIPNVSRYAGKDYQIDKEKVII